MLKKKTVFIIFVTFIFIMINISSMSYATSVPVTEENLNEVLQSFVADANDDNYEITMSDGKITIKNIENTYTLNYDLTNNPKFTISVPIQQGMSYSEFKDKTDSLLLPVLGYVAVANIQGVKTEDANTYFELSYLGSALSSSSSENSYTIVDDTNLSEGVTIEKGDDPNTIYVSEFGDRVMEYVNSMYSNKQTYSDNEEIEGFNTFVSTIEQTDVTSTSCNLVSTLTVNLDADFSKISDAVSSIGSSTEKTEQTGTTTNKDSDTTKTSNNSSNIKTIGTDSTVSLATLPKTGTSITIVLIISVLLLVAIILKIKLKQYRDIK